jgi:hypothetical protein
LNLDREDIYVSKIKRHQKRAGKGTEISPKGANKYQKGTKGPQRRLIQLRLRLKAGVQ